MKLFGNPLVGHSEGTSLFDVNTQISPWIMKKLGFSPQCGTFHAVLALTLQTMYSTAWEAAWESLSTLILDSWIFPISLLLPVFSVLCHFLLSLDRQLPVCILSTQDLLSRQLPLLCSWPQNCCVSLANVLSTSTPMCLCHTDGFTKNLVDPLETFLAQRGPLTHVVPVSQPPSTSVYC